MKEMSNTTTTNERDRNFDNLLAVESAFYERSREQLLLKYPNRVLLIHGEDVCGNFPTVDDAIAAGVRTFGSEPFLVRRSGDSELTLSAPSLSLGILRCQ